MAQTSIEWFLSELEKVNYHPTEAMVMYAKKLQRQEHSKTWDSALDKYEVRAGNYMRAYEDFDDYYQETFVSKGSDDTPMERKLLKSGFVDIVPQQETLYTEEQVREAIEDARDILSYVNTDEVIQSLKQPKKD